MKDRKLNDTTNGSLSKKASRKSAQLSSVGRQASLNQVAQSSLSDSSQVKNSDVPLISSQTISAVINSLKMYDQAVNLKSANPNSNSSSNSGSRSRVGSSLSEQSTSDLQIPSINQQSKLSNQESINVNSLTDSLINNLLSNSSQVSKASHSSSRANKKLNNFAKTESSEITNSRILSEFISAENSLDDSQDNSNQKAKSSAANVIDSSTEDSVPNGSQTSLNFTSINRKAHLQSRDNHQAIKYTHQPVPEGLHKYQKTINAHYTRHIILVLIIVAICCSFAGIIGYAATLV